MLDFFDGFLLTNQREQSTITVSRGMIQLIHMIQFEGGGYVIRINPMSGQPIFEQIISQIKMAVLKGYLKPGDSIPSVRKLALQLSVTPGTVAKAYSELEHQEVIVTIRGKGAYIAEKEKGKASDSRIEKGFAVFQQACMELIYMGVEKKEIQKELDAIYDSVGR